MKKAWILLLLLAALLLTACAGEVSVLGDWEWKISEITKPDNKASDALQSWYFDEKGSGKKVTELDGETITLFFTYSINEKEITLTFEDAAEPEQTFTFSGGKNKLLLKKDRHEIKLTRKGEK